MKGNDARYGEFVLGFSSRQSSLQGSGTYCVHSNYLMSNHDIFVQDLEIQRSKTARFVPAAFHIHSIDSHDWALRSHADTERNSKERLSDAQGIQSFLDELSAEFDIVCITDHMKVDYACKLANASLSRNDILVLPGMEINCIIPPFPHCIHLLAIFPPNKSATTIERIFACHKGFPAGDERTGVEKFDVAPDLENWVKAVEGEEGIVIVAHIEGDNGHRQVFREAIKDTILSFQFDEKGICVEDKQAIAESYARVLATSGIHAVEIMKAADRRHYMLLEHSGGKICRIPCVVRSDAHCMEELARPECKTYIKVARKDFRAVKDALNFFETRIRFHDGLAVAHSPRILGIKIVSPDGEGLFSEAVIAFNQNLNCLIGPRGSGKSTVIEALRYGLGANQPSEPESSGLDFAYASLARKIQKANLQNTLIQILYERDEDEQVVLNATYDPRLEVNTEVFDLEGNDLSISSHQLAANYPVRIYSWSEIETLGRLPELQRKLVDCLISELTDPVNRRTTLYRQLEENRKTVLAKCAQLQNKLKEGKGELLNYSEAQAEFNRNNTPEVASLFEQLDHAREKLAQLHLLSSTLSEALVQLQGVRTEFTGDILNEEVSDGLNEWWTTEIEPELKLSELEVTLKSSIAPMAENIQKRINIVKLLVENHEEAIQKHEHDLREQTQADAGEELKRNRRELSKNRYDQCHARREEYQLLWADFDVLLKARQGLMDELVSTQNQISTLRATSQGQLTEKLKHLSEVGLNISIKFQPSQDRDTVIAFMRVPGFLSREPFGHYKENKYAERCCAMATPATIAKGILDNTVEQLEAEGKKFSTSETLHKNEAKILIERYHPFGVDNDAQVKIVDSQKIDTVMQLQEASWDDCVRILLDEKPVDELSPGQRSSAMLPLIAIAETVPLIIDQPEDNLDNKLLGNVLTHILAELKETRQIIVATHNPNIVVGGDAEQVIVLESTAAKKAGVSHTGSIDDVGTIKAVLGIMEGGKEAFAVRERRYRSFSD